MSIEEADQLTDQLEQKWAAKHKRDFVMRMERKLNNRERMSLRSKTLYVWRSYL